MPYCIPVLGYYGHNNAGDEAFKLAFSGALGDTQHQFVTRLPEDRKVPLVVFGGGAILNDYFVKYLGSANNIYAVGCSFPYGPKDIHALDPVKDRLRALYLRSHKDVEAARSAGYDAQFIPDMVFSVPPKHSMTLEQLMALAVLPPVGFQPKRKKLFVFLSGDYWLDYLTGNRKRYEEIELLKERIAKALDVATQKYDVIMPSMSVWYSARDYIFAGDVLKRMKRKERVCLVERYVDAADLISVLAQTDSLVLSMKYHGLVFGMLNGRFCINVGSTRKTLDLMDDFGVPELTFDPVKHSSEHLIALINRAEESALQAKIAETAQAWKTEAVTTMKKVAELVRHDSRQLAA